HTRPFVSQQITPPLFSFIPSAVAVPAALSHALATTAPSSSSSSQLVAGAIGEGSIDTDEPKWMDRVRLTPSYGAKPYPGARGNPDLDDKVVGGGPKSRC
ncbi:unnamed protein product, partial [Ectocarpus sp. 12 AP-2014]